MLSKGMNNQTIADQSCVNNGLSLVCLTDWKDKENVFQVDTKLFSFPFCQMEKEEKEKIKMLCV